MAMNCTLLRGSFSSRGRRRWLLALLLGRGLTPSLAAASGPARTSASAPQPNILFILTDDHDTQSGTLAYMLHLQALLVDEGTTFGNMLVPLSLCCPSRTTILRGQYPHNSQVLTNALPLGGFEKAHALNLESATLATVLHAAGYRTVLFGKYLNGYPDTATPNYIPPGWDEFNSPAAGNPYSEYNYTLNENGTLVKYGSTPADYLTDVIYGRAVDFITRAAATPNQPIFIYFATYAPHSPYTPAPRHANLFPGLTAPKWPSFNEADVSDKPAYIANKALLTSAQIAAIDTDYRLRVQALQAVDEAIAGLIDALQATGRLANTYIVFASDNGYHMGEHRLLPGKYTPYETDLHVPLIVRGPGVPAGVTRSEFAANVDLAETFADLAGVSALPFSDGRSILPLLRPGPVSSWRQGFLLEEFGGGEFVLGDETDATNPASTLGIREPPDPQELAEPTATIPSYYGFEAPTYKYVEYQTGEKELYLLTNDPYELNNQAAHMSAAVAKALGDYVRTMDTCVGDGCRSAEAVPPPLLLTADFTYSPSAVSSDTRVTFNATASGTAPYTFAWDFAGGSASGATAAANLPPGHQAVTLHVIDAIGAEAAVTKTIDVAAGLRRHLFEIGGGAGSSGAIPASFFAMSAVGPTYPAVTFGTLAHQDFAWARIEHSRGSFDFGLFDGYIAAVQQHGLVDSATNTANMAMTLAAGTPGWAVADQNTCSPGAGGTVVCTAAPDNVQDWKDFLTALIHHYNGTTQPHIKYYELWNEFNISLWWTGTDAQLVALAQAAYPIIHQDPYSLLLTPSVAGPVGTVAADSGVTWMTGYLQAGGAQYADGGAFHGYIGAQSGVNPFPMPEDDATSGCTAFKSCYGSIITKATQMRAVFDNNGLAGKPIFQTEGSWGKGTVTDPDTQVAWLARFMLLQAGLHSALNLQMAAWFTWAAPTFGWGDIATASLQPTSAGVAYTQVYVWIVGATISDPCASTSDGTWTCSLTRPGGYSALAIWNAQGSKSYTPSAGFTRYRDLAGNATPISSGASVTIGAKPILLEHPAGP
ncbi:MAG: sulfatase-like hydrolase/transferase [Thermoanaerobaculales bacterium]